MSLNLVSPGTKVREVDLTIGRVDAINEQVGAIAGPFEKGPVDVPTLIETEQDLLATFGEPKEDDAQYEYWMTASSYLSYGGVLRVVRADSSTLNNANDKSATVKIKNYEDYVNSYSNATSFNYASKYPGRCLNDLKVCVIDDFADQRISVGSGVTAGMVGLGVTQAIDGRLEVGSGTTSSASGFLRGVITAVDTTNNTVDVKIVDKVSTSNVSTAATYKQGSTSAFIAPVTTTTSTSLGIATVTGQINEAFDASISGIATANIQLGDVVSKTAGTSVVAAGTTVIGIGASIISVDKAITGISTAGAMTTFKFERTSSSSTTQYPIKVVTTASATNATFNTATPSDWYDKQTLGLTNSTVFWKAIAEKPGTSEFAGERSGKNDEIHIVVVDDTGSVTGIAGNIVEKHIGLSKAKDGKISPSEAVYYKDYLSKVSTNIYAGGFDAGTATGLTATAGSTNWTLSGTGNVGSNAQGVTFAGIGVSTYTLAGGENYSATGGYGASLGDIVTAYDNFTNQAEYSINFLIQGPSTGTSNAEAQAKARKLIDLASTRKDCIACISPWRTGVVNVSSSDTQTENIIDFFDPLPSSSYAVFDSGYKYMFDRFNNEFRYIPLNGDIAGLMARTSINQFSWFSPAGASRGAINGAVKLAFNPSQSQRDLLYPKRINPVVFQPGSGIILFGDKTGLGVQSAFDRINVRRLFLTVEATIERAARAQLFEFNDVITRSNFLNIVEPFLRDVKAKRGITDFVVVCDETNNTPDIIDSNQFRADIFIKPVRSINFIGLTFVATRTGVSFEEVVGNV